MRLYLSSFRMGNRPDQLLALAGGGGRVAVIVNAMDAESADLRRAGIQREVTALTDLGFVAEEFDLRDYFADRSGIESALRQYDVLWFRGGNVFMLRYAMARSGADETLLNLLAEDAIVYAGYSAGPCVLAPSLTGLELVDDADQVIRTYGDPPIWAGLNVLDFAFVPHVDSPGHPETVAMKQVVDHYRATQTPYRTFRDGEVFVMDGASAIVYPA
ncbi:putative peptidase [mine drainage metagenome]|uniref:Putative peptidase n=1 Tax=mine drainage metagenome TaxID=410659 RepID=A0A1J5Q4L2_9ZZZZ